MIFLYKTCATLLLICACVVLNIPGPASAGTLALQPPPPTPVAAPQDETAIVAARGLRVRAAPDADAPVRATLPSGAVLRVFGPPRGVWLQTRLANGNVGWVNRSFLHVCGAYAPPERTAATLLAEANVRQEPRRDAAQVAEAQRGDLLPVVAQDATGAWLRVQLPNGTTGWLSRALTDYCGAGMPGEAIPTPAPTAQPLVTPARPKPTASNAWVRLTGDVAARWRLAASPDDSRVMTLTSQDAAPSQAAQHSILVLFTSASSAYDTALSTLAETLRSKQIDAAFTLINMGDDAAFGQATLQRAATKRFDLAYAMGSKAAAFVHEHARGSTLPIISICAKDPVVLGQMPDYTSGSGSNIAYTSLNVPIELQLAYLKELRPELTTIAVLYAAANASAVETQVKPLKSIAAIHGLRIVDVVVRDDANARAELAAAMQQAVRAVRRYDRTGAHSVFWVTGSTSVFKEIATINQGAAGIPVVSAVPDVVQAGDDSAVLSIGVSFESNAQLAALRGADVLRGTAQVGALPVGVVSPPDIAINFKKAAAINLKIPFQFFETASIVYDEHGVLVRKNGQDVQEK